MITAESSHPPSDTIILNFISDSIPKVLIFYKCYHSCKRQIMSTSPFPMNKNGFNMLQEQVLLLTLLMKHPSRFEETSIILIYKIDYVKHPTIKRDFFMKLKILKKFLSTNLIYTQMLLLIKELYRSCRKNSTMMNGYSEYKEIVFKCNFCQRCNCKYRMIVPGQRKKINNYVS